MLRRSVNCRARGFGALHALFAANRETSAFCPFGGQSSAIVPAATAAPLDDDDDVDDDEAGSELVDADGVAASEDEAAAVVGSVARGPPGTPVPSGCWSSGLRGARPGVHATTSDASVISAMPAWRRIELTLSPAGRSRRIGSMSGGDGKASKSVMLASEKARDLRLARLKVALAQKVANPMAVIDQLMAEMSDGDPQLELWEQFHAAALRDHCEPAMAEAYKRAVAGPRMKRLPPESQANVLMNGANFFQGILGDMSGAGEMLAKVVAVTPANDDAFNRLEKKLEREGADSKLVELYATVAGHSSRKPEVLAQQALLRLVKVTPTTPVTDDACRKLVALVPANPKILEVVEQHCRATKRALLGAEVIEKALAEDTVASDAVTKQRRQRAVDVFIEANAVTRAMEHIEKLLEWDYNDSVALRGCERLMSNREVSSRAAAALQKARRARSQ